MKTGFLTTNDATEIELFKLYLQRVEDDVKDGTPRAEAQVNAYRIVYESKKKVVP